MHCVSLEVLWLCVLASASRVESSTASSTPRTRQRALWTAARRESTACLTSAVAVPTPHIQPHEERERGLTCFGGLVGPRLTVAGTGAKGEVVSSKNRLQSCTPARTHLGAMVAAEVSWSSTSDRARFRLLSSRKPLSSSVLVIRAQARPLQCSSVASLYFATFPYPRRLPRCCRPPSHHRRLSGADGPTHRTAFLVPLNTKVPCTSLLLMRYGARTPTRHRSTTPAYRPPPPRPRPRPGRSRHRKRRRWQQR